MDIPFPSNELSRGQHSNHDFIPPPARKARSRNKKGNYSNGTTSGNSTTADVDGINTGCTVNKLDTIIERPLGYGPTLDLSNGQQDPMSTTAAGDDSSTWKDASTSTTDLVAVTPAPNNDVATGGTGGRVKKGQIHALAKMLSVLRKTPH